MNQYKLMKKLFKPEEMPGLEEVGFRQHSQFEEDGILLYIFSVIGTTNKRVVEICAGKGIECMAANLIINHGWKGLLFDGDKNNIAIGKLYYRKHLDTFIWPPRLVQAWITRDNINDLLSQNGFEGPIDLLSTDIDGNDYWILKEIEITRPRVIICETNNVVPSHLALTIPYQPSFNYKFQPKKQRDFMGVSLLGLVKLLKSKGYRLIGSHRHGFNAIFMENSIGNEYFPEVTVEEVQSDPYTQWSQKERWERVKDLDWEQIN